MLSSRSERQAPIYSNSLRKQNSPVFQSNVKLIRVHWVFVLPHECVMKLSQPPFLSERVNPVFRSGASPISSIIVNSDSTSEQGRQNCEIKHLMTSFPRKTLPDMNQTFLAPSDLREERTQFKQLIHHMRNLHQLIIIFHREHGAA